MAPLQAAQNEACTTDDIAALLRSVQAASARPAPWVSPAAAFLLGAAVCVVCALAAWVTQQRSNTVRSKLEGLASAAREGLSHASLSSLFVGDLPAWLTYPDVSRMEWANVALRGLWPQIDAAATKWAVLDGNLAPLLNGTTFWRPAWLASSGIDVKGLALGNQAPLITGVRAYERDEDTCTDRVMVDFHFTWSSKMEGEPPPCMGGWVSKWSRDGRRANARERTDVHAVVAFERGFFSSLIVPWSVVDALPRRGWRVRARSCGPCPRWCHSASFLPTSHLLQ